MYPLPKRGSILKLSPRRKENSDEQISGETEGSVILCHHVQSVGKKENDLSSATTHQKEFVQVPALVKPSFQSKV